MRRSFLLPALALALLLAGCAPSGSSRQRVLLVTTTTVEDSGLLDTLVTAYHAAQDRYRLATTAIGSGAALEIGRRGDADLLLTHDSAGEARLAAERTGVEQGLVMRNEFVVVGPASDPAGVGGATDLSTALARIRDARAPFVSRADDSGTHRRELRLWDRAGGTPTASRARWYLEAGAGMAETLRLADQRAAYALTDRGTFLHLRDALDLQILADADPPEVNAYRYTLPPEPRSPGGARDFLTWLLGPGQDVIRRYGTERFGEALFQPAASAD